MTLNIIRVLAFAIALSAGGADKPQSEAPAYATSGNAGADHK